MASPNCSLFTEFDNKITRKKCITPTSKDFDKLQSENNVFYGFILLTLFIIKKSK